MEENIKISMENRIEHIKKILADKGIKCDMEYRKVWKNNVMLDSLTIGRESVDHIVPTIYIGTESDEDLANKIASVIKYNPPEFDVERYFDKEYFEKHLRPRLISANETNKTGIEAMKLVSLPFDETGLLITLEIVIEKYKDSERASIQVSHSHLDMVGMSLLEAYESAVRNIENSVLIALIWDLLHGIIDNSEVDNTFFENAPLYVLTTQDKHYGAACLLSKKALRKLADIVGMEEFYILPSSVNEVIALPKEENVDVRSLLDMVIEINKTSVSLQEKLDDAVYIYKAGRVYRLWI